MVNKENIMAQSHPKIIAAIPCYNTEHSIGEVVSRATRYVNRVVVIDDGSTDATANTARATGAEVISHGVNKGYGEAIKSCLEAGRTRGANILVTLDGDGQHQPEEIEQVVAPILKDEADIVIGSRFLSNRTNMPAYRRFGIKVITFLFNFGSKVKVEDAQSGFRAYSKKALQSISATRTGMDVSVEIIIKGRATGLRIKEVPISCQYHTRSSTKNPLIHGLGVAFSVVKLRLKSLA